MLRPCWVIFREKPSVVVTLGCTIQLSENALRRARRSARSTAHSLSKHVGVCYNWRKKLFVHSLVFKVFLYNIAYGHGTHKCFAESALLFAQFIISVLSVPIKSVVFSAGFQLLKTSMFQFTCQSWSIHLQRTAQIDDTQSALWVQGFCLHPKPYFTTLKQSHVCSL
jgi:hypothetical protein